MAESRSKTSLNEWSRAVFNATVKQKLENKPTTYLSESSDDALEKTKNIYNDFYRPHPNGPGADRQDLTARQQSSFLDKLKSGSTRAIGDWFTRTAKKYKIYPQANGRTREFERIEQGAFAYRINKTNQGTVQGDVGRVTVNVKPGAQNELLNKMKAEAKRTETVGFHSYQSKIAAPDRFGKATEDGLFYVTAGQANTQISQDNLTALRDRVKLSDEKMSDYLAPGLEQISKGIGYAETPLMSPGHKYDFAEEAKQKKREQIQQRMAQPITHAQHQAIEQNLATKRFSSTESTFTSHGMAHSTIIRSALKSTFKHYGDTPSVDDFQAVYNYKLQRHGLDVNNPARRSNIDPNTIAKPWEAEPLQQRRKSTVVQPPRQDALQAPPPRRKMTM